MDSLIGVFFLGMMMLVAAIVFAIILGNSEAQNKKQIAFWMIFFGLSAVALFVMSGFQFRTNFPTGYPQESISLGVYKLEGSPQTYTEDDGTEFILFFTERDDNNVNAFRIRIEQTPDPVCAEAELLEVWDNPQEQRTYRFVGCYEPVSPNENPEVLEP